MGKTKDVRAAVQAELGFDPLVDPADIKVMNTEDNVITLTGHSVVGAAWMALGVIDVRDELQVTG